MLVLRLCNAAIQVVGRLALSMASKRPEVISYPLCLVNTLSSELQLVSLTAHISLFWNVLLTSRKQMLILTIAEGRDYKSIRTCLRDCNVCGVLCDLIFVIVVQQGYH